MVPPCIAPWTVHCTLDRALHPGPFVAPWTVSFACPLSINFICQRRRRLIFVAGDGPRTGVMKTDDYALYQHIFVRPLRYYAIFAFTDPYFNAPLPAGIHWDSPSVFANDSDPI